MALQINMQILLPMFYLLVLALVFGHSLGLFGGLARELEALFDGTEELAGHVVHVLEGGDDVGRAGDGFKELDSLKRVGDLLYPLEPVAVAKQNPHSLIIIVFGRVKHGR